jgi:hypothetical protein
MTVLRLVAGLAFAIIVGLAGTLGLGRWQARGWVPDAPAPAAAPAPLPPVPPALDTLQPSRLEAVRALRAKQYERLTPLIEALQEQAARESATEGRLTTLFDAFSTPDPTLAPRFDEWVAAEGLSFAPYVARARFRFSVAFARSGTALARDTSLARFAAMDAVLKGAVADARDALRRDPFVAEAYAVLVDVARTHGDQAACGAVAARGLERAPASLRIRVALAVCSLPRWGGSGNQVIAVAQEASSQVAANPALAALSGFWEWNLGREAETGDEALERYTAALRHGEHWFFYLDRADQNLHMQRYVDALADVERGLTLEPDQPDLLLIRLRARLNQGRYPEAAADADLVGELQSGDAETHYWRGRAYLRSGDNPRALREFDQAIALNPDDAEALFERSGTHFNMGNHAGARRDALRACELGKAEACAGLNRVPPS